MTFIAYYIILAFKQREACNFDSAKKDGTKVSVNVSSTFNVLFILGFALHVINFTIGTIVEVYVRFIYLSAPRKVEESQYTILYLVGYVTDLVYRFGFLAFSVA